MSHLSMQRHKGYFVTSLFIDLISSTEAGMKLSTAALDRFNLSLVNQIKPHLDKLGLNNALIKFTGDGWLIISDEEEKIPALCCLSTIMVARFQQEMSQASDIHISQIPSVRQSVCSGRDISVELPDGRKDWVGDSARRANRASAFCFPNEIIIDEPVRYFVFRDFETKIINVDQRQANFQPSKMEERFTLYTLGELRPKVETEAEAPEYYIYTLNVIGKTQEAGAIVQMVSEHLQNEAKKPSFNKDLLLLNWNRLLENLIDYPTVTKILKDIRTARITPSVAIYNTLIRKSPDFDNAEQWVVEMQKDGLRPNVETYNRLIGKAPYNIAKNLVAKMAEEGLKPDINTYDTLIGKAPNYSTAQGMIAKIRGEGLRPSVQTYYMLAGKATSYNYDSAKALINTMVEEGINPNLAVYNTLVSKSLSYDMARKLVKEMLKADILPDFETYNRLLSKGPDFNITKKLFYEMRQKGLQPSVQTYNILIGKSPDFNTAKQLFEEMQKEGLLPSLQTCRQLVAKVSDHDTAKQVIDEMRAVLSQYNFKAIETEVSTKFKRKTRR